MEWTRLYSEGGGATMKKAPAIVLVMSKEELLEYIQNNNAEVSLYGCPSGNKYSNCHNS